MNKTVEFLLLLSILWLENLFQEQPQHRRCAMEKENQYKCYGTLNCSKRKNCKLGECCLSRAKEEKEDISYSRKNVSVNEILYDPNKSPQEFITENDFYFDEEEEVKKVLELCDIDIPVEALPFCLALISKIQDFYFLTPQIFDALMNSIFKGKSQSDLAKERHISRQCVNKRLLKEINIMQKRNDVQERRDKELANAKKMYSDKVEELNNIEENLRSLSEKQLKIYICRIKNKMTASETAKKCNCSIRTVFRISDYLQKKGLWNNNRMEEDDE
jgi:hypothetical protein